MFSICNLPQSSFCAQMMIAVCLTALRARSCSVDRDIKMEIAMFLCYLSPSSIYWRVGSLTADAHSITAGMMLILEFTYLAGYTATPS